MQDYYNPFIRREDEALDAWQERAMESSQGFRLCLAITAKNTLCRRQITCHQHIPV